MLNFYKRAMREAFVYSMDIYADRYYIIIIEESMLAYHESCLIGG